MFHVQYLFFDGFCLSVRCSRFFILLVCIDSILLKSIVIIKSIRGLYFIFYWHWNSFYMTQTDGVWIWLYKLKMVSNQGLSLGEGNDLEKLFYVYFVWLWLLSYLSSVSSWCFEHRIQLKPFSILYINYTYYNNHWYVERENIWIHIKIVIHIINHATT